MIHRVFNHTGKIDHFLNSWEGKRSFINIIIINIKHYKKMEHKYIQEHCCGRQRKCNPFLLTSQTRIMNEKSYGHVFFVSFFYEFEKEGRNGFSRQD